MRPALPAGSTVVLRLAFALPLLLTASLYLPTARADDKARDRETAEAFQRAVELAQTSLLREQLPQREALQLADWHITEARAGLSRRQPAEALAHAERALELNPASAAAQLVLNEAKDAHQEAKLRLIQKASYMAKAAQAQRRRDFKHALTLWRKAQALDPDDPDLRAAINAALRERRGKRPTIVRAEDLGPPPAHEAMITEYRVGIGDVLEVFVWQHPDLSRDTVVRPDGRISFPLVGDIDAAGSSLTDIDDTMTRRLETYVRVPDVSLAIKRFGGTKTIILGEIARPGIYIPTGEGRLLDIIAMAGGFTKNAVQKNVMLIRGGLEAPEIAKLDVFAALSSGRLQENVALQPNDIVYVPKKRVASTLEFLEQFYPAVSEVLVGQSIATGFGYNVAFAANPDAAAE